MRERLLIIGASGHGKVIADIAKLTGCTDIAFLDDDTEKKNFSGYRVIGRVKDALQYKDCVFFVAIGNNPVRQRIQENLQSAGLNIITLIHPNAVIAEDVSMGIGTAVMAGAVINPGAAIGNGVIVNTASSIDHDCKIHNFAHISVGVHLAGNVTVGECTMLGAGAAAVNNILICNDCIIGAGAVVTKNVDSPGTYAGVPARRIK